MKFYSEKETAINAECTRCGKVLVIKKEYNTPSNIGYTLNPPVKCPCGAIWNFIEGIPNNQNNKSSSLLKCPRCDSVQVMGINKGFGLAKAAAGGLLIGPLGLLGGLIGSKKQKNSCMKCGHQ